MADNKDLKKIDVGGDPGINFGYSGPSSALRDMFEKSSGMSKIRNALGSMYGEKPRPVPIEVPMNTGKVDWTDKSIAKKFSIEHPGISKELEKKMEDKLKALMLDHDKRRMEQLKAEVKTGSMISNSSTKAISSEDKLKELQAFIDSTAKQAGKNLDDWQREYVASFSAQKTKPKIKHFEVMDCCRIMTKTKTDLSDYASLLATTLYHMFQILTPKRKEYILDMGPSIAYEGQKNKMNSSDNCLCQFSPYSIEGVLEQVGYICAIANLDSIKHVQAIFEQFKDEQ